MQAPTSTAAPNPAKSAAGRAGWSAERRAAQAARLRAAKIWTRSTGPRSAAGKTRSAQNARKHVRLRSEPLWHLYLQEAGLPAQKTLPVGHRRAGPNLCARNRPSTVR